MLYSEQVKKLKKEHPFRCFFRGIGLVLLVLFLFLCWPVGVYIMLTKPWAFHALDGGIF